VKRRLRTPNDRPPNPPAIRRSPRADLRLRWTGGVTGYEGRVRLGGVATGWATIADVCGATWEATVSQIDGCDVDPGFVTVELLEGPRRGLFAIGSLEHRDLIVDVRHAGATVTVFGRSDFGSPLA
jgi:hypothetical protein